MLAVAIFVSLPIVLYFDIAISRACRQRVIPGDLRTIVRLSEVVAHGYGIALILLMLYKLIPEVRRELLRVAMCACIPSLITLLAKISIARSRPNSYLGRLPDSIWETFGGISPALTAGEFQTLTDRTVQSFPSGHATAAVGFALGLSWLFPKGKWFFASFAALAMLQRIQSGAHFASDTLAGACVALFTASILFGNRRVANWFTRFERKRKLDESFDCQPKRRAA